MSFLMFMNTTVGRWIRVIGGVALIAVGLLVGGAVGTALALFALLPIATGVFGVCPINPLFGQSMTACSVPTSRRRPSAPTA
jgi:glucose dehydrogenase